MSSAAEGLLGDIESLARRNELDELEVAVGSLADVMAGAAAAPDPSLVRRAANALRAKRQFAALARLAEIMTARGFADPTLRRLHAQALIDSRHVDRAIPVLEGLLAELPPTHSEHKEARGLLGRAWKQAYVDRPAGAHPTAADAELLRRAIAEYGDVVQKGDFANDHWHLVNFVALTARAERDGIHPGHEVPARTLAEALIGAIGGKADDPTADMWTLASLGEGYIALGDLPKAKAVYQRYLEQPGINAFEVFSSWRQLGEVWQLKRGDGVAGEILALLEARLAGLTRKVPAFAASDVTWMKGISDATAAPAATRAEQPEHALQGGTGAATTANAALAGALPVDYMHRVLRQACAVVRIRERYRGRHVGTGFLVRGSDLDAALGPDTCLVTNSHVIGREAGAGYAPRQVEIELRDLGERKIPLSPQDADIVWESPVSRLDTTVLRLKGLPAGFEPLPLCAEDELPDDWTRLADEQRQCYFIGHAGDLQLSITLTPNRIHDLGFRDPAEPSHVFIHHDADTRDGSSGSPILNLAWRVIGLHRAGTAENELLPALGGRAGDRMAKVAVSINAIRRAMAQPAEAAAGTAAPALAGEQLLALLRDETASEDDLAARFELDEMRSQPFHPVVKPRPAPDGTSPELTAEDVFWINIATAASFGFQARRNRAFGRSREGEQRFTFVSEGDSWFQFPVPGVSDTVDHLRQLHSVYCHAIAGSVLRAAAARAHERVVPSIVQHKPDGVLLSGGGNDLLGFAAIDLHVARYRKGEPAEAHILPSLANTLNVLIDDYEALVGEILRVAPKIRIFMHGYDYALPSEPSGRWLYQPLSRARGITDIEIQRQIVRLLIDRFNERLAGLETKYAGNVFHVDCRGAIGATAVSWYDELHPRSPGFGRVAARFNRRIAEVFAGDPRAIGIA